MKLVWVRRDVVDVTALNKPPRSEFVWGGWAWVHLEPGCNMRSRGTWDNQYEACVAGEWHMLLFHGDERMAEYASALLDAGISGGHAGGEITGGADHADL